MDGIVGLIVILLMIPLTIIHIVINPILTKFREIKYDYYIITNNCNCSSWGTMGDCLIGYGIKDGEITKFNSNYDKSDFDESNIFSVSSNSSGLYYDKAKNEEDKEVFRKIVLLAEKEGLDIYSINRFIITEKNYYIHLVDQEMIYKFNQEKNTLESFFETEACNISKFYEK